MSVDPFDGPALHPIWSTADVGTPIAYTVDGRLNIPLDAPGVGDVQGLQIYYLDKPDGIADGVRAKIDLDGWTGLGTDGVGNSVLYAALIAIFPVAPDAAQGFVQIFLYFLSDTTSPTWIVELGTAGLTADVPAAPIGYNYDPARPYWLISLGAGDIVVSDSPDGITYTPRGSSTADGTALNYSMAVEASAVIVHQDFPGTTTSGLVHLDEITVPDAVTVSPVGIDAPGGSYDDAVIADTPLVYYKLDESLTSTALDSSGNGDDATYAAGTRVAGLFAGSTYAREVTDDLPFEYNPGPDFITSPVFTAEFWYSSTSTNKSDVHLNGSLGGASIVVNNDVGALPAPIGSTYASFYNDEGDPEVFITAGSSVADGDPHHLVLTADGSQIEFFIDGVSQGATAITGSFNANDFYAVQRASPGPSGPSTWDEAALYATDLSPGSILGHYSPSAFGSPTLTSIVQTVESPSIMSMESVGSPTITALGTLYPDVIPTEESFGMPELTGTFVDQVVSPLEIESAEDFPFPSVMPLLLATEPYGIETAELIGVPVVTAFPVLYYFDPPVYQRSYDDVGLWRWYHLDLGAAVLKESGVYSTVRNPPAKRLAAADAVYMGGRRYEVGDVIAAELIDAGYGARVTEPHS